MHLIRFEIDGAALYRDSRLELDFFATDRVARDDKGDIPPSLSYTRESCPVYTQNVVAFAGVNASGKTTTLNYIKFVLNILSGESIDRAWRSSALPLSMSADSQVEMKVLFWHEGAYYLLESSISFSATEAEGGLDEGGYSFNQEALWVHREGPLPKKAVSDLALFKQMAGSCYDREVSDNERWAIESVADAENPGFRFLRADESIASALSVRDRSLYFSADDYPRFVRLQRVPEDVAVAFDSSIESLTWDNATQIYQIKFFGREPLALGKGALDRVLSKGTIVGSGMVDSALRALRRGSYLIVDEIENSLNKSLVQSIIGLFASRLTNPKGATLVFSTHYPEILDSISRKDNVYLLVRDEEYRTGPVKYSDRVKRIENKKSEVIFSNIINGTAPNYSDIEAMRRFVESQVSDAG